MTWDWRAQPLNEMSGPQLEQLVIEGDVGAQEYVKAWLAREAQRRPIAERLDNYGRVKTSGGW